MSNTTRYSLDPEKWREYNRNYLPAYTAKLRARAMELLGGKCVRCGYDDDARALQFDHKAGDGWKVRKESNNNHRSLYIQWIKAIESGTPVSELPVQILCSNCNQIKRHENKEWRSSKKR